jgi:hypothetical protein
VVAFSGSRRSSIQKSCFSPKRFPVAEMNCHGPAARAQEVAPGEKPLSIIARYTVSRGSPACSSSGVIIGM